MQTFDRTTVSGMSWKLTPAAPFHLKLQIESQLSRLMRDSPAALGCNITVMDPRADWTRFRTHAVLSAADK